MIGNLLSLVLATVSFPDLFTDHAIVQKDAACAIWGRAEKGERVTVTLGAATATARAGAEGWWLARLDTRGLGEGPHTLTATAPSGRAESRDILVGEVWLAAGQSNMEFTMKGGFGPVMDYAERERACVGRPIRMFRSPHRTDSDPFKGDAPIRHDAKGVWRVISPKTLGAVSAVGYTFIDTLQKTIGGAAGVVDVSWSGTRCWAWMPRHCIDAHPELAAEFARQKALIEKGEGKKVNKPVIRCWNNQFMPVANLSCRGVIWYQGCCDSGLRDARHVYPTWLSYMVAEWRREMGKSDLPFLYCQLAGWGGLESDPAACPSRANLREGQRRAQKIIPKSAMAVILDNSEYEIHGRFKGAAGDRLAALALNRVYGRKEVVCFSPNFAGVTFEKDAAIVRFEIEGSPLKAGPIRETFTWNAKSNDVIRIVRRSSNASELEGFTLRDEEGTWHWADAKIVAPDTVKVWAKGAMRPTAVRYNMRSQGFGNLYNAAGLPASCFTTEDEQGPFARQRAEFAKYHRAITGRDPAPGAVVFAIDPKVSASGRDAYRIVSEGNGARIIGANERCVWFGLYDLLERRGGCRWFWDGDRVPKKAAIDLSGLDVKEEARFEYRGLRYFAHRGLTRFQAEHWSIDDWKREIDWILKRRLNVFMPRIGMDDTWQKAYPEIVPYPDPNAPAEGGLKGYDNRVSYWGLKFRGELRKQFTDYAFARGLMIPADFGTMTHWYSRTPQAFLDKMKPPFLPVSKKLWSNYKEPSGLVWDVFQDGWLDRYWHLTDAFVNAGYGDTRLLHTIGLGERNCFDDRAKNHQLKIDVLKMLIAKAQKEAPNAKVLLAGWDFYCTWKPEEVRALIPMLDPKTTIVWDYEAEAFKGGDAWQAQLDNNWTKWGLIGKFPYTFGIFLAYESALDIRANYPVIEKREKIAAADPMCKGYILWPESSHTDTFLLRYFTANAWRPGQKAADLLLPFCRDRYGEDAERFASVWRKVIALSTIRGWGGNWGRDLTYWPRVYLPGRDLDADAALLAKTVPAIQRELAAITPKDEFQKRDVVDLARTALDREVLVRQHLLRRTFGEWVDGKAEGAAVLREVAAWTNRVAEATEVLSRHTDYSLRDALARLEKAHHGLAPNFDKVLIDNAGNSYCRSHQYEFAAQWYQPMVREIAAELIRRVEKGERKAIGAAWIARLREKHYQNITIK